ncbi:SseB family protein [Rhodalgimonas zhirmunskyi]|uniref:SseB family protein n=1 Tax=Rhodalgimonas zhirmunskyi TaxID=2964767 RepID=A0AAJ1UEL9_9RHOB|nr:SseB family protein [Rhodoalgimonas zhirmunskyi]MDQ2094647.1 SseB family protein [Rhodoalgimonas zhirmunskyi]
MTRETPLDTAHAAMEQDNDGAARLAFYDHLAAAELFLMLAQEAGDEAVEPALFDLEEGRFVMVFDSEERLADFAEGSAPYAALPGRALATMLAGQGIGIGLNLGVAPSSILLPATAIDWLAGTLAPAPEEAQGQVKELRAPELPEGVVTAIDRKLAQAAGLAKAAYLVGIVYENDEAAHLLAVIGAQPGDEPALAGALREALVFSGLEEGALDVGFFDDGMPVVAKFAETGLRFDLPEPVLPETDVIRPAPGSDPDKPPILK